MTEVLEGFKSPKFTGPALFGVYFLAGAAVVLLLITWLRKKRGLGLRYVLDDSEGAVVRRSQRSVKKPQRWEPPLIGQGDSSSSPVAAVEKVASKATRAAKQVAEKVKEEVKAVIPEVTPPSRGRGRPRKSDGGRPKSPTPRKIKSPSPPRTRRTKTPRS